MKKSLLSLFTAAAVLTVPQVASASVLLAGFVNFTTPTTDNTFVAVPYGSNYGRPGALGGWSGLITTDTSIAGGAATTTGGSFDGAYGNINPITGQTFLTGGSGGNGSLALSSTQSFVFSITSNNPFTSRLDTLLFDAARVTPVSGSTLPKLTIAYSLNAGSYTPLISSFYIDGGSYDGLGNLLPPIPMTGGLIAVPAPAVTPTSSTDYKDFNVDLQSLGLYLPAGETINFKFTWASGDAMRIDNIGLVALPEPGSMLALGCLVGSGAFLRIRRRGARNA